MTEMPTIDGPDGAFAAYYSRPAGEPIAAVVVVQEVFGINEGIRRKCDTMAEAGYLAIAPDLFWRMESSVELDPDVPEELERGLYLGKRFDQDAAIRDIEATIRAARAMLPEDGKVGAVGYCMGGHLAYMAAARTDVDASVGYYGVGIDGLLGEQHAIANPLMLHIAGSDHFVDTDAQRRMHEGLNGHPRVTLHDYLGEDHGFATEFGERRSDAAAKLADERTAAFLAQHLKRTG